MGKTAYITNKGGFNVSLITHSQGQLVTPSF